MVIFCWLVIAPDSVPGNVGFVCNKRWLLTIINRKWQPFLEMPVCINQGGTVQELGHELIIQEWLNGGLSREFPDPDMLLISHRIGAMDGITLLRKTTIYASLEKQHLSCFCILNRKRTITAH